MKTMILNGFVEWICWNTIQFFIWCVMTHWMRKSCLNRIPRANYDLLKFETWLFWFWEGTVEAINLWPTDFVIKRNRTHVFYSNILFCLCYHAYFTMCQLWVEPPMVSVLEAPKRFPENGWFHRRFMSKWLG